MQDPLDGLERELANVAVHDAPEPVVEPQDLVAQHAHGPAHDRADGSVQPGTVAPAREDADPFHEAPFDRDVRIASRKPVRRSTSIVRPDNAAPGSSVLTGTGRLGGPRMRSKAIALVLCFAALVAAVPASAHDVHHAIRADRDLPEARRLAELHRDLHRLLARYEALERQAGRAWIRTVETFREAEAARAAADSARLRFDQRVRAAYQFGPGGSIEALLGATTLSDLSAIAEYTARTISIDDTAVGETVVAEAVLSAKLAQAEAERAAFAPRLERLQAMLGTMQRKVREAARLAEKAHLEAQARAAHALAAQERQIAAAMSRLGSWDL